MCLHAIFKKGVWLFCLIAASGLACTVGVVNGVLTVDGRPILFKNRDSRSLGLQALIYHPAEGPGTLAYIGVGDVGSYPTMGLNAAGLATGNSRANDPGRYIRNPNLSNQTLARLRNIDEVRSFIDRQIQLPVDHPDNIWLSGCFPYIDAHGNAVLFEVSKSKDPEIGIWCKEYDSMNPARETQKLYGMVLRGNKFHRTNDGLDNLSDGANYGTCRVNMQALRDLGALDVKTLIQGTPDQGVELFRCDPYEDSRNIARWWTVSTMVIHGVKVGEDPALTTMWAMLGKADYCMAVPAWVRVSNIPKVLSEGDFSVRSESLFYKGRQKTIQASIRPVETHVFNMVNEVLLPHWRENGVPPVSEMERVEHQIATDVYSLLLCLDEVRENNKAPVLDTISVDIEKSRTVRFGVGARDSDGKVVSYVWDFGDGSGAEGSTPKHTYKQGGTYLISCTVKDNRGVTITVWKYITAR